MRQDSAALSSPAKNVPKDHREHQGAWLGTRKTVAGTPVYWAPVTKDTFEMLFTALPDFLGSTEKGVRRLASRVHAHSGFELQRCVWGACVCMSVNKFKTHFACDSREGRHH